MADEIIVHKGRTVILPVQLSYDVSQDTIRSQIRKGRSVTSAIIAEWAVSFRTDGRDGKLIFRLDDAVTSEITENMGFMDIKRVTGGEPIAVLESPIPVVFRSVITS